MFYMDQKKVKTLDIKYLRKRFVLVMFGVFIIGLILFMFYVLYVSVSLPNPNTLITRATSKSTIIYDRNGEELYRFYQDQNREFLNSDNFPINLKNAVLASEDINFYEHNGIDIIGIARCTVKGIISALKNSGEATCGASTITQQLVRNTIMVDKYGDKAFERSNFLLTLERKLREIILTLQV